MGTRIRWVLGVGIVIVLAALLVVRVFDNSNLLSLPEEAEGRWAVSSLELDGRLLDVDVTLEVEPGVVQLHGACNSFRVDEEGWSSTAEECASEAGELDLMLVDDKLTSAVQSGGELVDGGQGLTFETNGTRIEFRRSP